MIGHGDTRRGPDRRTPDICHAATVLRAELSITVIRRVHNASSAAELSRAGLTRRSCGFALCRRACCPRDGGTQGSAPAQSVQLVVSAVIHPRVIEANESHRRALATLTQVIHGPPPESTRRRDNRTRVDRCSGYHLASEAQPRHYPPALLTGTLSRSI